MPNAIQPFVLIWSSNVIPRSSASTVHQRSAVLASSSVECLYVVKGRRGLEMPLLYWITATDTISCKKKHSPLISPAKKWFNKRQTEYYAYIYILWRRYLQ